jgi:hypothetical protein
VRASFLDHVFGAGAESQTGTSGPTSLLVLLATCVFMQRYSLDDPDDDLDEDDDDDFDEDGGDEDEEDEEDGDDEEQETWQV